MSQNDITDIQAAGANTRDKLIDGLKSSINDAEKWLEDSADDVSEAASAARIRFDDTLRTAISDLRKLEDSILAHSRDAADSVNVYVRDNPWKAVTVGATIGLLLGVLISRK
ncbi:DUF883 domain-containing protein [Duganella dendranthematis]|jgi:ElaB/YqjD/DUF883 family membrane-anchored ribosome-binding protein|uniref:DUF883 domain-containing protein n=1 Tax=Duganella dendranthematis TaxID=2728021 RepID=A0ABX6MEX0_9BURK|nr:DUF883 family protein [Duganella dendranthematis]QJD91442.1 DUF883 domain-containing protein [Duganella dendranthematis]